MILKTKNVLYAEMEFKSQLFLIILWKPPWIVDLCS